MLALGHTPLWPMVLVVKNTVRQSQAKYLRGLIRYGNLSSRAIVPVASHCCEEMIDFGLAQLCAALSCRIYGPEFNRFFNEDAPYLTRLMGMLATYMPCPYLKYSQRMTKWEIERVIELADLADSEYVASNVKGSRAYQPGWVLLVNRKAMRFYLVIRGTVNKGDLILDLDATSVELESGLIVHSGMHKAALWVGKLAHPRIEEYKNTHAAKSYKLIITGHSLGAGVAMALGHNLLFTYPSIYSHTNLTTIGFGCPAMAGLGFVNEARSWAINYVYDCDMITRLSLHSIQAFLKRLELLAEDKDKGRTISTRELSQSVHTDRDLYVPGKIILLQAVHASDERRALPYPSDDLSFVEESGYAQTVYTTYEATGVPRQRIFASEISPHDLGEFIPNELGLIDHGFYGHLFTQTMSAADTSSISISI